MMAFSIPAEQKASVRINHVTAGALCSYKERTVQKLAPVENIGSGVPSGFCTGKTEHSAVIRFAQLDTEGSKAIPADIGALKDFTLEIRNGRRKIFLYHCEFSSFETSYEVGGPAICTMEVAALSRSCTDPEGKEGDHAAAG